MKSHLVSTALLAAVCAHVVHGPQAQEPPLPTFRVEVDAVELDVFVTDAQGNPVTDLTADDFEILEEGSPQAVTSFTQVHIPLEPDTRPRYSPTAIEPDVRTNTVEGRLYVIALDEVRPVLAQRTRHFLRRFLEQHFAANDMAAVVFIGRGRASDTQDFTSNRRLLLNALDRFTGGFAQEAAVVDPLAPPGGGLTPAASEADAVTRARMRSLRDILEFMGGLRGRRKAMLYVTEQVGDIFSVLDYNGGVRSIAYDDLHAAVTAATRGNVSIYPVDPTGLGPDGALGETETAPVVTPGANLARVQGLRTLAETTGGFAVVNSNEYDQAFARIVRENSSYYVLGFTSTHVRRDGRYRRVQVRVNRPGVQVRSREGYLAPKDRPDPARSAAVEAARLDTTVSGALASPLGSPAVPMRVFAAPYRGEGRNAAVAIAVEIDAAALGLAEKDGVFAGQLEIRDGAVAANGRTMPGGREAAELTLRPDTFARVRETGIRAVFKREMPPGRYQLRVAAGLAGARAGAVVTDVEVPDFTREPFSMSGMALTSSTAAGALTLPRPNPLEGLLPGPITAAREFTAADTLALYTEIYENPGRNRAAHTVSITMQLRTDDGRVVRTSTEERSSKELDGKSGGYGFAAQVPLAGLEPGTYVIRVEAQMNMGDRPTVGRDISIRVVP